eukprot:jgi/Botrbrau1/19720/Bobra.0003s0080.1
MLWALTGICTERAAVGTHCTSWSQSWDPRASRRQTDPFAIIPPTASLVARWRGLGDWYTTELCKYWGLFTKWMDAPLSRSHARAVGDWHLA